MNGSVVLVEPVCIGFEHAQFNAPLLRTVTLAFPGVAVTFLAERGHLDFVRSALAREAPGTSVAWKEIDLPPRDLTPGKRLRRERILVREAFRFAADSNAMLVLFASATDTFLVAAKLSLYRSHARFRVLMILHNALARLEIRPRRFNAWRGISLALTLPHPRTLRLIVPGSPIQRYLEEHYPRIACHTRSIDHPSFWGERSLPDVPLGGPVRFGFFGVSAVPGFDTVVRLARALRAEGSSAEFSMVGHLNDAGEAARDTSAVPDASSRLLSPGEYADRAKRLTYALWTTRSHRSGLVASSAFVDALSFVKPLIYLANPFIDAYAGILGDIGYRCADEEEMLRVVRLLAAEFPAERYRAQCAAIHAGRRLFDPETVAEALRRVVHET